VAFSRLRSRMGAPEQLCRAWRGTQSKSLASLCSVSSQSCSCVLCRSVCGEFICGARVTAGYETRRLIWVQLDKTTRGAAAKSITIGYVDALVRQITNLADVESAAISQVGFGRAQRQSNIVPVKTDGAATVNALFDRVSPDFFRTTSISGSARCYSGHDSVTDCGTGYRIVGVAIIAGILGSLSADRLARSLIAVDYSGTMPLLALTALAIAAVAFVTAAWPTTRAVRIDVATSLRAE